MANYDELIGVLEYLLNNRFAPKPEFLHGLLGNGLGNVVVPDREDYVYVRFSRGASESFEAFNREAPAINDLPVLIGKKFEDMGLTQVVGIDWSAYIEAGWGDSYAGVALHAESHQWPDGHIGQDPLSVYTRALVDFRAYVVGSGTSTIYAAPLEYEPSGTYWPGSPGVDFSLPMLAMVTGTARYMGLYLDPGSNALGIITGTTTVFSDAIPIPRPEFPLGVIPCARIRLYGGQDSLTDADILDARRLFYSPPTGTSDGFPVGPAGGDLTGTYPDPRVAGLYGYSLLDTAPAQGDRLYYTGGAWEPSQSPISFEGPAGGDLTGTYPNPQVSGLFGYPLLDTAPGQGDILLYTGSAWRPVAFSGGGGGGGWPYNNILTVDSTDPDADYSTITAAIAAASAGDTIQINGETFTEQVDVDKAVTLEGAGFHDTKITNATSPTLLVSADGAALVNIWVDNTDTGAGDKAIYLQYDCELRNVKATSSATSGYGVHIDNGPTVNIIQPDFAAVGGSASGMYIQSASTDVVVRGGRIYGGAADVSIYVGATVDLQGPVLENVGVSPQNGTLTGWWSTPSNILIAPGGRLGIGIAPGIPLHVEGDSKLGGFVGIGAGPVAYSKTYSYWNTTLTTGDRSSFFGLIEAAPAGASTANYYGVLAQAVSHATVAGNLTGNLVGFRGTVSALHVSPRNLSNMWGVSAWMKVTGTGSVTNMVMFRGEYIGKGGSGGTVTNAYGLYLPSISIGATLNYSIYSAGGTMYHAGNVGIATLAPSRILDTNNGSGNMISDGYDTHSLSIFKENISDLPLTGYLTKLKVVPLKKWQRTPFVSTNELVKAAGEHFGEDFISEGGREFLARIEASDDKDDQNVLAWINQERIDLREERRQLPRWQREHIGLVADDPTTLDQLPDIVARDYETNEPIGIGLNEYVGFLHGCNRELLSRVEASEAKAEALEIKYDELLARVETLEA